MTRYGSFIILLRPISLLPSVLTELYIYTTSHAVKVPLPNADTAQRTLATPPSH
jgi:hypothetical protein